MTQNRENNYDLLRIVSTIAVISIHVSAYWLTANTDVEIFGELYHAHLFSTCLWNVLSRFAVPCFMMLSGALLLSDERNAEYAYFYKKQFKRIGIPTLVFIALYLIFDLMKEVVSFSKNHVASEFLQPVITMLCGDNHLWYLYSMAGVYVLAPIIIRVKRDIGEKKFAIATGIFLVLASIGYETSSHWLMWDIGFQFRFVGYFMAGYVIRRILRGRKNNIAGSALILAGGGIECLIAYIRACQEAAGINADALPYKIVSPLCPWIVVSALCVFVGFTLLNCKVNCARLAKHTFMIYLVHAGIWDILFQIVKAMFGTQGDSRILIPISVATVFGLSLAFSVCLHFVRDKLLRRNIRRH